jgi:hypothetical protein
MNKLSSCELFSMVNTHMKGSLLKTMQDIFGIAPTDTSKDGKNTGSGDGAKLDLSWANDLVQKLKLVKEGSLNALKLLQSLQKFLGKGNAATKNPMLDDQLGKLKQLEQQAIDTKTSLATNLVGLLTGLDPEQFALVYDYLFEVDGTLKDVGKTYNEAFKVETIASYLQVQKESNDSLDSQIQTFNRLTDAGYKTDQIIKILEDDTLALDLANGGAFSEEELKQFNAELTKTLTLNQQISEQKLGFAINDLEKQVDAYNKLSAAGVKQEVILEILKDKSNVWAIASADGTVDIKDKFGGLINKTKEYSDLLELIKKQTLTFEQKTQEAIDSNVAALDLQARTLQNTFDVDNFELKAKIKVKEGEIEKINKEIEDQQDLIDPINFDLKYDPEIGQNFLDDLQETISDLQRGVEFKFDREIQDLSDRSAILSNDLTLIDKASEAINEKYDKQEEALRTISELNQDIAAQEQKRISLADALSQGDISAAAQMAQEMRSTAAEAASRASGDFLSKARTSEIDNLRSASGMTRTQIQAEQFRIEQQTFALEQSRKIAQAEILKLEDQVYNITERREAKLLQIRTIEAGIDLIKKNQLADAQKELDKDQKTLEDRQKILDADLAGIEQQKLKWESVQIQLEAYRLKLKSITDGELKSMADVVASITAALATISSAKFDNTSAFTTCPPGHTMNSKGECVKDVVIIPQGETPEDKAAREAKAIADAKAAQDAADAKAAQDAANAKAAADAKAALDAANAMAAADLKAKQDAAKAAQAAAEAAFLSGENDYATRNAAYAAIAAAKKAKAEEERLAALAAQNAQWVAKVAALQAAADAAAVKAAQNTAVASTSAGFGSGSGGRFGMMAFSSGGMVKPKYFAVGGKARGTDIIPAMLTPGEFVMSKYAVDSYGVDKMKAINSGSYEGEKVYNYNLNVNVKSDANPEDIARVVMTQIRQVDSQRIRTQRT